MRNARELHIIGSVQGVGFRWTAKRIADQLGIAGWVRNNPDGSVTLHAEGEEEALNQVIERLDQAMGSYMAGVEAKDAIPDSRLNGFDIVR